ncbi:MAG: VanW family protein [Defluviitaleaceae bacterium]|nr:VanW family protein [Defluviitaleaceae bacterium]
MKKLFLIILVLLLTGCASHLSENEATQGAEVHRNTRRVNQQPSPRRLSRQQPSTSTRRAVPAPQIPENSAQTNELPALPIPSTTADNAATTAENSLGSHETDFQDSDAGRENNIKVASRSINGKIVQPQEVFSFNDTVGSTTKERGYEKAVIYANGVKKKNYGGGVCQVSTTLCNAAMNAGMSIIERHDHSLPVKYAEEGKEAATSQNGDLDFKFKNENNFPVRINASAENGRLHVSITEA